MYNLNDDVCAITMTQTFRICFQLSIYNTNKNGDDNINLSLLQGVGNTAKEILCTM